MPPTPAPNGPVRAGRTRARWFGWGLFLAFAPHLAYGSWVAAVPDHLAFVPTQLATLAHVLLAAVTWPLGAFWLYRHAVGARAGSPARTAVRWLLALGAGLAFLTGLGALWSGEGMPEGGWHAVAGLSLAVPLAAHLLLDGRRVAALVAFTAAWPLLGGVALVRHVAEGVPARVAAPTFAFKDVDHTRYDSAAWCAECHGELHAEWSHSTHARAMQLRTVKEHFEVVESRSGARAVDTDLEDLGPGAKDACVHCHAPTTFYGDDRTPARTSGRLEAEGISCSFCHTVRGLEPADGNAYFVSAPQTVRRYLWQADADPLRRSIGNWLIRWRPELHRADYHPAFLDSAQFCAGCHASYHQWVKSPYARFETAPPPTGVQDAPLYPGVDGEPSLGAAAMRGESGGGDAMRGAAMRGEAMVGLPQDPTDLVSATPREGETRCQDCHMVGTITGDPAVTPGPLVAWGPDRPQRRSHGFRGGNAAAALSVGDEGFAFLERALRKGAIELDIESLVADPGGLRAAVIVRNVKVGHHFPTGEGGDLREVWLGLVALDADGHVLAESGPPGPLTTPPGPYRFDEPDETPRLRRGDPRLGGPGADSSVPPKQARRYVATLRLDPVLLALTASVRAVVQNSFDPVPSYTVEVPYRSPVAAN